MMETVESDSHANNVSIAQELKFVQKSVWNYLKPAHELTWKNLMLQISICENSRGCRLVIRNPTRQKKNYTNFALIGV